MKLTTFSKKYKTYLLFLFFAVILVLLYLIVNHYFIKKNIIPCNWNYGIPNDLNSYIYIKKNKKKLNDDHFFFAMNDYNDNIPGFVDLRLNCPKVYDQGDTGLCHINATCFAYKYICLKNGRNFNPSRLFCEYNLLHLNNEMSKLQIKNTIYNYNFQGSGIVEDLVSIFLYGICDEEEYPFPKPEIVKKNKKIIAEINNLNKNIKGLNDIEKNLNLISKKYSQIKGNKPTKEMYLKAQNHKILNVYHLDHDIKEIKKYLYYFGPVLFHFDHGDDIAKFMKKEINLEMFKNILKYKKLNQNDKTALNQLMDNLENHIKNDKNKRYFVSHYNDLNNIKMSKSLEKIFYDYSDKNIKKIKKKIFKNAKKSDLTLKFPTELIKKSEKYLIDHNIDINKMKKNFRLMHENNIPHNIIKKYDKHLEEKSKRVLSKSECSNDINDFINKIQNKSNGHIMTIVGYDDDNQEFIIANSWGDSWGDNGYFYMDYEFFTNKDLIWGNQANYFYCLHNTTDGHI